MNLTHHPALRLAVHIALTSNEAEMNPRTAQIPALWQRFHQQAAGLNVPQYGVYTNYESDANGPYTVAVGSPLPVTAQPPAGMTLLEIPAAEYLIFEATGPQPSSVIQCWQQIWSFFGTSTEWRRTYQADFEEYLGPEQARIFIGAQPR